MEKNTSNPQDSPFKGWFLAFLLLHTVLSFALITQGVTLTAASVKAGNFFGLIYIGYFLLPVSLVLLLKRVRLARIIYILYGVFFFIAQIDPANIVNSLLAAVITAGIVVVPWAIYLYRSKRVNAFFAAAPIKKNPAKDDTPAE